MKNKVTTMLCILMLIGIGKSIAGTIHGFVRSKKNKEPIIMGNVWIQGTWIGTATNMKGYYVIPSL